MVVQRTLTPPVGVRSSHPQPLRSRSTLLRIFFRGVAQLVARLVRDQEAVGSNPVTPTKKPFVPCPGTNGFFVLECRGFEQPDPAAAGRKSARWAVCEGAGESRHPTGAALYRVPVQTAFLSWSAEDLNSPSPPQWGANQPAVLCENCCHNVKIAKWAGILPQNGV